MAKSKSIAIKPVYFFGAGLLALLLWGFTKKATGANRLNFYFNRIESLTLDKLTPVLTFTVLLQNTSDDSYTINSIAGNIYCNNILIGNVSMFNSFTIAPSGQNVLSLTSRLNSAGIINDLIKAIQYGQFSQKITFDGYANIDNYQLPFTIDYTVGNAQTTKQ